MADLGHPVRPLYRWFSLTAAGLAFGLIVLGGVVRISGSGLGCGDQWPKCNGSWIPPFNSLELMIEYGHRWVALLLTAAIAALLIIAWRRHRQEPRLRNPATLATVLLTVQILLGPVIVKLDLPPAVIVVHLLNAMALLGVLVVAALRADGTAEWRNGGMADERPLSRLPAVPPSGLVYLTAALGFIVLFFGALTANLNAGLVCQGFPLCQGQLGPPATLLGVVHWTHRILAFSFLAVVIRASLTSQGPTRRATMWVFAATILQIGIAAAMVLNLLPAWLRAAHLFAGTMVWVALVRLLYVSTQGSGTVGQGDHEGRTIPASHRPSVLADLITLTKPRIISLLLVTTVAPMFITPQGLPSAALVLWVLVGGYLMAGGANTINMWFDRDIDDKMSRTRLRPIPAGRLPASAALAFGITQGIVAFGIFWFWVNPLSAWLALGGLLFYVFVYTIWLKRSSPQNIVIGGAAGAFPPLVGWAAVTGSIDLAAIYLFAIIFYWTPPHFWALALIKQGEYAKAGVPMMPVVRGNHQTKVQMLAYTLMLLPLTVMPTFFGAMGVFYGVTAGLLGARLLWYCIRLLKENGVTPTAWGMYKYSLLYLFLLFVAMGVDRAVPFGHSRQHGDIFILNKPDVEALVPVHNGH